MKKNLIFAVLLLLLIFSTVGVYGQTATDANKRGLAALDQKDYDNAIAEFTEAIKLNPNNAVFYFNRGIAYYRKNDYDNAIENFTNAIQLNSDDANFYYNRGRAYYEKKDYDNAITDYTNAIRLNPDYTNAYNSRGLTYNKKEDYDSAIKDFIMAIQLNPNSDIYFYNIGRAYYYKKEYKRAITEFTNAIQLNPNDADAYAYRGYAYYRNKDKDRAIADAKSAKQIDPNNKTADDLLSEFKEDNFSLIIYLCVFLFILISFSFIIYKFIVSPILERKRAKQMMKDERFKSAKIFKMAHPIVVSLDGFIGIVKSKKINIINIKEIKGFHISFDGRIIENDTGDLLFNNIILKLGPHLIERTEDIYLQLDMADNTLLKTYLLEDNATRRGGGRRSRGIKYTDTIPFYTQNDLRELFGMLESIEKSVKEQS
jgi:tetratricopeptide (TPR) repeat protein